MAAAANTARGLLRLRRRELTAGRAGAHQKTYMLILMAQFPLRVPACAVASVWRLVLRLICCQRCRRVRSRAPAAQGSAKTRCNPLLR